MTRRYILLFIGTILFFTSLHSQKASLETVLQNAINHRQTQNAAHDILWGVGHSVMADSWSIDQEKGEMTVVRGTTIIKCKIKIIGTYDHKDSTFLWSIYNKSINQKLTSPVKRLADISKRNGWNVVKPGPFKCSFEQAFELATLAFYLDSANGLKNKITNNGRTNVLFTYYDIEITDRMFKAFNTKISTKRQYEIVDAPALIDFCKKYVQDYYESERKYYQLYEKNNQDKKYMDTMFSNRVRISDSYWDTVSVAYPYHRKNRLIPDDIRTIGNWRVVTIGDSTKYVLYDEKQSWGGYKTWAFEMCVIDDKHKIRNEFMCL